MPCLTEYQDEDIYVKDPFSPLPTFIFAHTKPSEEYVPLSEVDPKEEFFAHLQQILLLDDPNETEQAAWVKFANCFQSLDGLFRYIPFLRSYLNTALKNLIELGVDHVETRVIGFSTYDKDRVYDYNYSLQLLEDIRKDFAHDISLRVIHCVVRTFTPPDKLRPHLELCQEMMRKFPDLVVGFDFVGYEDGPHNSYAEFKPVLKEFVDSVQFFLHAGETSAVDTVAARNVFDAVELETKRIGHGLSLKHYIDELGPHSFFFHIQAKD
ncbi:cat eye syndrome chromosome region, candidate 1 [Cladochytrium tenue]|nr:cat eye syndrome chromosome region, candidate 1 [Cladochytrium tenue]